MSFVFDLNAINNLPHSEQRAPPKTWWYYPLMVDSEKRGHVTMNSNTGYRRGFLLCQRRKAKPLIDIAKKRRKKPFVCEWKKVGRTVKS